MYIYMFLYIHECSLKDICDRDVPSKMFMIVLLLELNVLILAIVLLSCLPELTFQELLSSLDDATLLLA